MKHLKRKRKSNYSVRNSDSDPRRSTATWDLVSPANRTWPSTSWSGVRGRRWRTAWTRSARGSWGRRPRSSGATWLARIDETKAASGRVGVGIEAGVWRLRLLIMTPLWVGGDQSLRPQWVSKDSSCDWQDLTDLGEPSTHTPGVKMEDDEASSYRVCTRHRYNLYSFHQIVGILGSWVILTHGGHKSLSIWMLQTVQFGCFCLTEINFVFCKDALNWSKVTVKTFIMLQKFLFQINAVLLNFLFIKVSWKIKCITVYTKTWGSTTVFNIDNNLKYFLSSKSAY